MDETTSKKPIIVFAALVVLLVITFIIRTVLVGSFADEVHAVEVQASSVQAQIDVKRAEIQAGTDEAIENAQGISFARVEEDNLMAKNLLATACTWSSYDEYQAARETLLEEYSLREGTGFMATFMPQIPLSDMNGQLTNIIDDHGYDIELVDVTSYPIEVNGGSYSYFAEVTMQSTYDGVGQGKTHAIMLYTVDSNGVMSELDGMLCVD